MAAVCVASTFSPGDGNRLALSPSGYRYIHIFLPAPHEALVQDGGMASTIK